MASQFCTGSEGCCDFVMVFGLDAVFYYAEFGVAAADGKATGWYWCLWLYFGGIVGMEVDLPSGDSRGAS